MIRPADLPVLFDQQLDDKANWMAAFGAVDPSDRAAFDEKWTGILADENLVTRAIEIEGRDLAGSIALWRYLDMPGPEVTYWLGRPFWGRGIASAALGLFLVDVTTRPLFGGEALTNLGSIRVLEHVGFVRIGEDSVWSDTRGETVPEAVFRLDGERNRPHRELPTFGA